MWLAAGSFLLLLDARGLTEIESSLFSGSGNCAFCHDQWSGALLDSGGNNVSISGDWQAAMMAHSFLDPLWRARMEAEVADRPELREFIEDKCMTCHAPMARTQFRHDEHRALTLDKALQMELAHDGVSCTLCHQIQAGNLGEESSLDGGYIIGDERQIFGPYTNVVTGPMQNHVDYTPGFGAQVQDSAFCATCHTLFTPILDEQGKTVGQFPEQVPYLEWRNSRYPDAGRHCQDCHMPRLDEPIRITARPPWIGTREPFWRHTFLGANTFMLKVLADPEQGLSGQTESEQYLRQLRMTQEFLKEQTVTLTADPEWKDGGLAVQVTVENRTGHKFPTGYPYRRAWLRFELRDRENRVVFTSGAHDDAGQLVSPAPEPFRPHYAEITAPDQVQVYEAVMGDPAGKPTTHLLRAARYLKDNRIPPNGFRPDGPHPDMTAVRGAAADDPAYSNGSGADAVLYKVPAPAEGAPYTVKVELLYQSVPPKAVAELLASDLPFAKAFRAIYEKADKAPETITSVTHSGIGKP